MQPYIQIILPTYMVMAILGLFVAVIFLYFRIENNQLLFVDFLKMILVAILYGAIGSRLLFVITRLPWLITNFTVKNLLSCVLGGGYVFYGGLLGLLFGVRRYCIKHKIEQRKTFDMIAPAIPLFHAFGRVGCFLAGCCHGFKLSTPITLLNGLTLDKFPTQLIEALFVFILFLVIYVCQKKNLKANYLRVYLISYALFRFVIEFTRGDAIRGVIFGISTSQIISIVIILVAFMHIKNEKTRSSSQS